MIPYDLSRVRVHPYQAKPAVKRGSSSGASSLKSDLVIMKRAIAEAKKGLRDVRKTLKAYRSELSTLEGKQEFDRNLGNADNDSIAQAEMSLDADLDEIIGNMEGYIEGVFRSVGA